MNKIIIDYYCPFCNNKEIPFSNPYNGHICSKCGLSYHKSQLISKEINIDEMIEEIKGNQFNAIMLGKVSKNNLIYLLELLKNKI